MRGLAMVGQLGFAVITPPVVLVWLAELLVHRRGWGYWIVIVALLVGLITGLSSGWRTLQQFLPQHPDGKPRGKTVHFDDHR